MSAIKGCGGHAFRQCKLWPGVWQLGLINNEAVIVDPREDCLLSFIWQLTWLILLSLALESNVLALFYSKEKILDANRIIKGRGFFVVFFVSESFCIFSPFVPFFFFSSLWSPCCSFAPLLVLFSIAITWNTWFPIKEMSFLSSFLKLLCLDVDHLILWFT